MPTKLSLDVIEVKQPCTADWSAMTGSEQARHCAHCNKHVYNLSAMSLSDAERLICESAGAMCVRFERLSNGSVRTLDYQASPGRRIGWKAWVGISLILSAFAAAGERWWSNSRTVPVIMGGIGPAPNSSIVMGDFVCPTTPAENAPKPEEDTLPDAM